MGQPQKPDQVGANVQALHERFAACYDRVQGAIRSHLRGRVRGEAFEEAQQVAEGLAWKYFRRCAEQGKPVERFPSIIGKRAAQHALDGRNVAGKRSTTDVLSAAAQAAHGFSVASLPTWSTLSANPIAEALTDNTRSDPSDGAAFRLDFASWFASWDQYRRDVIDCLMSGETTKAAAQRFGKSPGRISQLRQLFHDSWELCQA